MKLNLLQFKLQGGLHNFVFPLLHHVQTRQCGSNLMLTKSNNEQGGEHTHTQPHDHKRREGSCEGRVRQEKALRTSPGFQPAPRSRDLGDLDRFPVVEQQ